MRGNTVTAHLKSTMVRTKPLWQYDYGQILILEGVELPFSYEVHFSNEPHGNATTNLGDENGVLIPDIYLTTGKPVYAWLYLHDGTEDGETEYSIMIPVERRARPTNQEPTPVQQDIITQAIAVLNDAVEITGQDVTDANAAKEAAVVAQAAAEYAQGKAEDAQEDAENSKTVAINAKEDAEAFAAAAEAARDTILTMEVEAESLPAGSQATVSYNSGLMSFGIPRGGINFALFHLDLDTGNLVCTPTDEQDFEFVLTNDGVLEVTV